MYGESCGFTFPYSPARIVGCPILLTATANILKSSSFPLRKKEACLLPKGAIGSVIPSTSEE